MKQILTFSSFQKLIKDIMSGKLRINLLQCKFEHDVDKISKMDPFIKMKFREADWKSSIAENAGKNPQW